MLCECVCWVTMRLPVLRHSCIAFCILSSHGSLSSSESEWPLFILALASDTTDEQHAGSASCQLCCNRSLPLLLLLVLPLYMCSTIRVEVVCVFELGIQSLPQQLSNGGLSRAQHMAASGETWARRDSEIQQASGDVGYLACSRYAHQYGNEAMRDVEVTARLSWMVEMLLLGHWRR